MTRGEGPGRARQSELSRADRVEQRPPTSQGLPQASRPATRNGMKIRFVSSDTLVIQQICALLPAGDITVVPCCVPLQEPHTGDPHRLVGDQLLTAFKLIGKPVFIEHTGLEVRSLNDFPAGLTRLFWETLLKDRFAHFIGRLEDPSARMRTVIGYCDGRKRHYFEACLEGRIAPEPAGTSGDWSSVFVPDGSERTLAELAGPEAPVLPRKQAVDALVAFLREHR
ncbi:non-canonical purine NTP pyrophosphatase [Stutzerimonas tarimensis]|uniref:Non-canonical purine NTP pyrophosphatase n=1 Tax=Stutzerimonas tarimensis TaxID=1507735 RepID=A0ABV7T286_9GAMM